MLNKVNLKRENAKLTAFRGLSSLLRLWMLANLWNYCNGLILRLPCLVHADFTIFEVDWSLQGSLLATIQGIHDADCTLECVKHPKCKSYNIQNVTAVCELNSKIAGENGSSLVQRPGWVYKSTDYNQTEVGETCQKLHPCASNVLCRETCHHPYYECIHCDEKQTGLHCDKLQDEDKCESDPCLNNGTCTNTEESYKYIDECGSAPCRNGGTCTDQLNSYHCSCPTQWQGSTCAENNYCHSSPCLNQGTCTNSASSFQCSCAAGFQGNRCETENDYCHSSPCLNEGTCTNYASSFQCDCATGYSGDICEEVHKMMLNKVNLKRENAKLNAFRGLSSLLRLWMLANLWNYCNGLILRLPCLVHADFTIFEIDWSLQGSLLATIQGIHDADCTLECVKHPKCKSYNIQNVTAVCELNSKIAGENGSSLVQRPGWVYKSTDYNQTEVGETCQKLHPCASNVLCRETCHHPYYECIHCDEKQTGLHCDKLQDEDKCESDPCLNNGTCTNTEESYKYIDECASAPCLSGGTCTDDVNSYHCSCIPPWYGSTCADFDDCDSSPCQNGGNCTDLANSYSCSCPRGYGGVDCSLGKRKGFNGGVNDVRSMSVPLRRSKHYQS
eukprot:gene14840-5958_t